MVSYAAPGRRRRPALRFLRRISSAGARPAHVGREQAAQPELDPDRAAQDPARLPPRNADGCWNRATCSTCLRGGPTTASRSSPASPIRSDSARRRTRKLRRNFSPSCRTGSSSTALYATEVAKPTRHPAEIPERMVRQAAVVARRIRWNRRDVETVSRRIPVDAQTAGRISPAAPSPFSSRNSHDAMRLEGCASICARRCCSALRTFSSTGSGSSPSGACGPGSCVLPTSALCPAGRRMPAALLRLLHGWYLAGWLRIGDRDE